MPTDIATVQVDIRIVLYQIQSISSYKEIVARCLQITLFHNFSKAFPIFTTFMIPNPTAKFQIVTDSVKKGSYSSKLDE